MKLLRNKNTRVSGIKTTFYTIIKNGDMGVYSYYLNLFFSKKTGDKLILKQKHKSKHLNKYTLVLLSILFSISYYLTYPLIVMLTPFLMYLDGANNFIRDSVWVNNVRYFNWVNFILFIVCIIILTLK